jgi:thiol-disulfide isomerase/thioredoxin
MNRIFLALAVFFCFMANCLHGQEKTDVPAKDTVLPYRQYPTLPAFNILMMDSTTIFNTYNIPTGGPIALFFFSTDCGHCKRTTRRLIDSMEMLTDIRFYMITPVHSMTELRNFYTEFHMERYENIKLVGRDYEFFFGTFYKTRYVPDVALYDGQKKLIKLIEGETTAKQIMETVHPK